VRRLVKGDDRFVGVFLNFGVTAPKRLPPPSFALEDGGEGRARVRFTSALPVAEAEWALTLDGVRRGAWRTMDDTIVDDAILALDGEHEVAIAVRSPGVPLTASEPRIVSYRVQHTPAAAVPVPAPSSCSYARATPRGEGRSAVAWVVLTGVVVGLARRRRRSALAGASLGLAAAASVGAIGAIGAIGASLAGCSKNTTQAATGCGGGCTSACRAELPRGLTGSYLAATRAADGRLWFSGYEDSAVVGKETFTYGDWHVGAWDDARGEIAWEPVAGMPAPYTDGRCPDAPATSYRGGRIEQGSDVGRSTSIAVSPGGNLVGAAYDATASGLRFASRGTNGAWTSHLAVSRPGGDVGRHARVVFKDAVPWVFYLATEPSSSGRGLRSSLEVARASTATPTKASDWSVDTIASVAEGPCRQVLCAEGTICSATSRRCEAIQRGCAACDGGACIVDQPDAGATCDPAPVQASLETSLPAFADGFALLEEGTNLTFAVNDGATGTLALLSPEGAGWRRIVVDGDAATGIARGGGPSLVRLADGALVVFSFDGASGALTYATVRGAQVVARGTVDEGAGVGTAVFDDAPHAFGRETAAALAGAAPIVFYQDAKLGVLRRAVGTATGNGAFRWQLEALPLPEKKGGFFPVPLPDGRVAHFWRSYDRTSRTALGGVAVVTP